MALHLVRGNETPKPLGTFRSITTRDAGGTERDGQPYYAYNTLRSAGRQVIEIQFGDGTWMLADPQELDTNKAAIAQHSGDGAAVEARALTEIANAMPASNVVRGARTGQRRSNPKDSKMPRPARREPNDRER